MAGPANQPGRIATFREGVAGELTYRDEGCGTVAVDVELRGQAGVASRMIVTAVCGSGTVIVTLRPLCRVSRRTGPVRTVK